MKTALTGLTTVELQTLMKEEGLPPFRGKQIAEWIYKHGAGNFDDMPNIPVALKTQLTEKYTVTGADIATVQHSRDGTAKLLLMLNDGNSIETVALPYNDRFSCCVSTQAGCPIGCRFCASGSDGFIRNLEPGEIIDQVLAIQRLINSGDIHTTQQNRRIDHIVFMGMGEPLLNYDSTLKAVHLLNNEMGIGIRNITISTIGIVPGIYRLAKEDLQITLALSLHAPNDTLRRQLVPGINRWNISETIEACHEYVNLTGRRVTFEYCMLDGINDGEDKAQELAIILSGLNCHVNLIRFNPVKNLSFRSSPTERVTQFRNILEEASIQVTQRLERGAGIDAACGQLRQQQKRQ